MLAVGIGVILSVIVKALLVIGLVLGGAYVLTTYVSLPGFVDVLIWIGAGLAAMPCSASSAWSRFWPRSSRRATPPAAFSS